ncbi:uncharacterized protein LOC119629131 [Bombyx mori]|uniref:uncharacterized protein LOC119629131 n=1 Tax=Bombyx mori TaxID=7091 RepID=UPI002ED0BAB4
MDFKRAVCIVALVLRNRKKRRQRKFRKYWIHPLTSRRFEKGFFQKKYNILREHPEKFFNYFRMSVASFDKILHNVRPYITFMDTKFRKCISTEERLSVTLRYLASGNSMKSLYFEYLIGTTTLSEIIEHTCKSLWICLQPTYMPEKTEEDWINIANFYFERTHFPNCLGSIDGKHIRIERPENTGSEAFNYKKYYSLILLAIADADYCFTAIDVGAYGSNSDSSVFKNSNFGKRFLNNQMHLPESATLPDYEEVGPLPFVFVGDEAFPLMEHLMRPYPNRNLSIKQRVYNYRLSYARRTVECAFGIMANKWRILHRPLDVKLDFCDHIITKLK